ncbi:hypothetical protein O181_114615 [Austropuccinia psidii MF-1]|uniref:Uncharacterized protein n=1 Tax=Austropuccinia psidii MF-1 TaxID=1389203 RepID=A0A9Q3K8S6_9BASI|nr:hypothetical protein [Austropuccinia psidii MF-1]
MVKGRKKQQLVIVYSWENPNEIINHDVSTQSIPTSIYDANNSGKHTTPTPPSNAKSATNHSFGDHYHHRPLVYTPSTHSLLRVFLDGAPTENHLGCTYSPVPITQSVERMNLASLQSASAVSWTTTDNAPIRPSEKQVKEKKQRRYK